MNKMSLEAILFCWFVVLLGSSFPGRIEGHYYPVIADSKFEYVINDKTSTVKLDYLSLRDCTLKNLYWYIGADDKTKIRISTLVQEADIEKDENSRRKIVWTMNAAMSDKSVNSSVYVEHTCNPFWSTITRIK